MKRYWANDNGASKKTDLSQETSTIVKGSPLPSTIVEGGERYIYDNDNVNVNGNENDNVNVYDNVNDNGKAFGACGERREKKRKNNYNKNIPELLRDEPSYDMDAFTRKSVNLKFEKKESPVTPSQ